MLTDACSTGRIEDVRALYEAAFPKDEKKPFEFILEKRKEGFFDIWAIENKDGGFGGLAIMLLSEDLALLDYLAVHPDCRGAGLGGSALHALREKYGKERIVVEIENTLGPAAEQAENREERLRRKAFYLRNGMTPMNFLVDLFGVEMEVLTFGRKLTYEEYYAIYRKVLPDRLLEKISLISGMP